MSGDYAFGDVVFIRVDNFLYRRVAETSRSWTSHVGLITEREGEDWLVAESRVPRCDHCTLKTFIARSKGGSYAIRRLKQPLDEACIERMKQAIAERLGCWYDLGFNYDGKRQFCSKFVYDIYRAGPDIEAGHIETFRELLTKSPDYPLWFWRLWFFGFIPWDRRTVSPGSQYESDLFETIEEDLSGLG